MHGNIFKMLQTFQMSNGHPSQERTLRISQLLLCTLVHEGFSAAVGRDLHLFTANLRSDSEVAQSCLILCDPMDCSLPGSSVHGILQARILEWVAISSSRGIFLIQGSNPDLLHCRQSLYRLSYQGSPKLRCKTQVFVSVNQDG